MLESGGIFRPMTRNTPILLLSHLAALVVGYAALRAALAVETHPVAAPEFTKLGMRNPKLFSANGEALLADFREERSGMHSRYAELKATLPVAKDLKGAVISAIEGLGGADWRAGLAEDEQAAQLAEVEVRVWHWMKKTPVEAMSFLLNDAASEAAGLPRLLAKRVFREVAAEDGVLKSAAWLLRDELTFGILCEVALNEIRAGGGFALFEKLEAAVAASPNRGQFHPFWAQPLVSDNPSCDGGYFLNRVGAATRFEEKEALLAKVKQLRENGDQLQLLSGFAGSGGEAAGWLLGLRQQGALLGIVAAESLADLEQVILGTAALDLEQRLDLLREDPDFASKSRPELVDELAAADVARLLETGRDWRYEFRNGTASLKEIEQALRRALPEIPDEALRVSLYRELVEQDAKRALPLLDGFAADKRRVILFDSTWQTHRYASPDEFLRFLAEVPDAATPDEQERKIKGWNSKARTNLWRYGDDYVGWVRQMPPGIHQEVAMNSVLWATAEQNPAQARRLSEQFYPPKP